MIQFDHISIIAPSLEEGIDYVHACLDIELINGNTHIDMGTHNKRVKLGPECYLEIIAINPDAPPPPGPRWFGFDKMEAIISDWSKGVRLKGWVARTNNIDEILRTHGHLLGEKKWLDHHFYFSVLPDGALPMGGILPSIIDIGDDLPTATSLVDQGLRLIEFVLEHPDPARIIALYKEIGIISPPKVIEGPNPRFRAMIDTPGGLKILR